VKLAFDRINLDKKKIVLGDLKSLCKFGINFTIGSWRLEKQCGLRSSVWFIYNNFENMVYFFMRKGGV
jgi:hypothetical protein